MPASPCRLQILGKIGLPTAINKLFEMKKPIFLFEPLYKMLFKIKVCITGKKFSMNKILDKNLH